MTKDLSQYIVATKFTLLFTIRCPFHAFCMRSRFGPQAYIVFKDSILSGYCSYRLHELI